jgi:hypothetical protein
MEIKYLNSNQQPLQDAVVSVSSAPGQIRDIAMITGADGTISLDVEDEGNYVFNIYHNNQSYSASAYLIPSQGSTTIVLE